MVLNAAARDCICIMKPQLFHHNDFSQVESPCVSVCVRARLIVIHCKGMNTAVLRFSEKRGNLILQQKSNRPSAMDAFNKQTRIEKSREITPMHIRQSKCEKRRLLIGKCHSKRTKESTTNFLSNIRAFFLHSKPHFLSISSGDRYATRRLTKQ